MDKNELIKNWNFVCSFGKKEDFVNLEEKLNVKNVQRLIYC